MTWCNIQSRLFNFNFTYLAIFRWHDDDFLQLLHCKLKTNVISKICFRVKLKLGIKIVWQWNVKYLLVPKFKTAEFFFWKKCSFSAILCFSNWLWQMSANNFLGTNPYSKHETFECYLKYNTVSNILWSYYAWVQHSTFLCILYLTGFMSNGENYSMCFRD